MNSPLVSIICLCHNQAPYVEEALQSAIDQTYKNLQLIVVDDGSTDGSQEVIQNFLKKYPKIPFLAIQENLGNCAAFNKGWRVSKGEYLIDLAADDILLPDRVNIGVDRLEQSRAGVHFSDALLVDKEGKELSRHNERFLEIIPEGNVYCNLVSRYWICPPTMMFRRNVIESLNGYDESLAYEDFDFWVRSSRDFHYAYSDEILVKKRLLKSSHARSQEEFRNSHQRSTLVVCKKILKMNRTKEEGRALKTRCWHEIRQCIKKGNLGLIPDYLSVINKC